VSVDVKGVVMRSFLFLDEMDNFFDGLPMELTVPREWKGARTSWVGGVTWEEGGLCFVALSFFWVLFCEILGGIYLGEMICG